MVEDTVTGKDAITNRQDVGNPDALAALRVDTRFEEFMMDVILDFHHVDSKGIGVCGSGGNYCMADPMVAIKANADVPDEVRELVAAKLTELKAIWKTEMDDLAIQVQRTTGVTEPIEAHWIIDGNGLSLAMGYRDRHER